MFRHNARTEHLAKVNFQLNSVAYVAMKEAERDFCLVLYTDQVKHTIPFSTFPNTTCLPSSQGVFTVVIKNCEPFVSFPAFAILSQPAP